MNLSVNDTKHREHARTKSLDAPAVALRTSESKTKNRPNLLLLSTRFKMPYRVLRCAQNAGACVYVLGTTGAVGLKHSRYCKVFSLTNCPIDGKYDAALAEEINRRVVAFNINWVLAGDAPSTRTLIAIRDLICAPCFPMPDLEQFDLLNNKWRFSELCSSLGIKHPHSRLFSGVDELSREIEANNISFPAIAKPLNMDSGDGCIKLSSEWARSKITDIFYNPILVQEFIEGEDIVASVYCERGEIRAFVAHRYRRNTYRTFYDDAIFVEIKKLMGHLKVNGVFNFDMRLARDGSVFYLECNPRFFFSIAMSMIAGINFVSLGLSGCGVGASPTKCGPVTVRFPKAILASLFTPWNLNMKSWEAFRFVLSDPIPYFREELRMEDDNRTAAS
jgi:predicted ATP-grasp superfamily ATP-dependent carboligase